MANRPRQPAARIGQTHKSSKKPGKQTHGSTVQASHATEVIVQRPADSPLEFGPDLPTQRFSLRVQAQVPQRRSPHFPTIAKKIANAEESTQATMHHPIRLPLKGAGVSVQGHTNQRMVLTPGAFAPGHRANLAVGLQTDFQRPQTVFVQT